ncbi:solute carrier family 28 member 3-like isoform X3 [Apostichopus japonicus]|uniref:solute carrier family 28 member 3-like isoform X3 n=1 Tax=Stichopus japonicus TaxID=307972 RepID=UPI003AB8FE19
MESNAKTDPHMSMLEYEYEKISLNPLDKSSNAIPAKDREMDSRNVYTKEESGIVDNAEDNNDFQTKIWTTIDAITAKISAFRKENKKLLKQVMLVILLICYTGYLTYACYLSIDNAMFLLSLTGLVLILYIYSFLRDHFGDQIWHNCLSPAVDIIEKIWKMGKRFITLVILAGIGVGIYFLSRENPEQLISGVGLLFFVFVTYIFSEYPRKVKWRPVIWGLVLQFLLALFVLKTKLGYITFNWLGDVIQTFLGYSDEGAKFVFGDPQYLDHLFAFKVLPSVIYFSTCISVLYYWGAMQYAIKKIAWLMERTMKISAAESLNVAGNIFVGPTEAPLLIKPILKDMTKSELHAVMTGAFATLAGSVLGAYIAFGISASHLLSASVMSAPAALAIAKLFYPETEKSKFQKVEEINLPKGDQKNLTEAISRGAITAIPLTLNIAGNLIAFIAVLALLNGILGYLGSLVGVEELSFEIRSEVIATYALSGFSNVGTIGIQLGALTSIAPSRGSDLAEVAIRAFIGGTTACFMTACVAGILYDASDYETTMEINATSTALPTTYISDLTSRS